MRSYSHWKDIKMCFQRYFSLVTVVILYLIPDATNAAVTLSKDPAGTAIVGETVRFECVHQNEFEAITWVIDGYYYTIFNLPEMHSRDGDAVIIVNSVQLRMNGTTYQCIVQSMLSNLVYLLVELEKSYASVITPSTIKTSVTLSTTVTAMLSNNTHHANGKSLNDHSGTILALSVLVPGSFLLGLGFATFVSVFLLLHLQKKLMTYKQGSRQAGVATNLCSDREPIKINKNDAYDTIAANQGNTHQLSQNPIYEQVN